MGLGYLFASFGMLSFSPIAGALLGPRYNWNKAIAFHGVSILSNPRERSLMVWLLDMPDDMHRNLRRDKDDPFQAAWNPTRVMSLFVYCYLGPWISRIGYGCPYGDCIWKYEC